MKDNLVAHVYQPMKQAEAALCEDFNYYRKTVCFFCKKKRKKKTRKKTKNNVVTLCVYNLLNIALELLVSHRQSVEELLQAHSGALLPRMR